MNTKLLKSLLIIFFGVSTVIALTPSLRTMTRQWFLPQENKILSQLSDDLLKPGQTVKVFKVKTTKGIRIEIHPHPSQPNNKFPYTELSTGNFHDSYFEFKGTSRNLFTKDLNGDGFKEIIAPTFDAQGKAQLNIFTYDPKERRFKRAAPSQFQLESL